MTTFKMDHVERDFFKRGDPLKKLLKITLDLLSAEQVGILYGTNASKDRFLPTSDWDRGVMDIFDGRGMKGKILKLFGTQIVTLKKLSPVYFYKQDSKTGERRDNDGIISYMLRTCTDYYRKGISILFSPDISGNIYKIDEQYACIPFYSYNGTAVSEPEIQVRVDLNIIKHFQAKNYVSIYIPDYGIMVVNTADQDLMDLVELRFVREAELKAKFNILIEWVEIASLAALGRLKGKKGAHLLWKKEKQLRRTSFDLVENEKKYRDLYENAPIAYFSMDVQGNVTKCNNNSLKLTGYSKEDLIGRPARELYVDASAGIITPQGVRQMLEQGRPVRDVDMRFRNKNGQEVWVSISLDAVRDKEGNIDEFRAMAIDISERKALEKQLVQAQKMEAIGTLAGGIAHDFNNILTPIAGYTEMLLTETDATGSLKKEHLQIIHDCALYAKGLVNQILTFSRQRENEFKLLQPHVFVRDALALAKSFVPATIVIREKINENCSFLMVDPIQAHQVVMNLISNACHAMEDTGGVLDVVLDEIVIRDENEVYPLKPGTYSYLKFSDTGHGIPLSVQEKIFDPFFTTKKEGKGSGIGLSVVHGIIRSHNGHITVKSKEGEGACFEIYLPAYTGDIRPEDQRKEESLFVKGNERILLVDDDQRVAVMEQYMLETLGYHVTCHQKSPEALLAFRQSPKAFDLVITDLTMPNLTGDQLAEKITEIRPGMPIILCTGYGEQSNKEKYKLKGIKGFLHKPVAIKDASHMIRDILDNC